MILPLLAVGFKEQLCEIYHSAGGIMRFSLGNIMVIEAVHIFYDTLIGIVLRGRLLAKGVLDHGCTIVFIIFQRIKRSQLRT